MKHKKEFAQAFQNGDFVLTDEGVMFPRQSAVAAGFYHHTVNGKDLQIDQNNIPDAAVLDILNVYFGATAKQAAWYLALFAGALNPPDNLTGANFAATMSEITSGTEGYSELTRPQFTPGGAAGGVIGNLSNKAQFSIVTTGSIIVEGAGLLSTSAKGGTSGICASAARFANPRELFNGDDFELGYTVTLTG